MLAACAGVSGVLTGTATTGVSGLPSLSYIKTPCAGAGSAVTRIALMVPSASVPVSGIAIDVASSLPAKVAGVATGAMLPVPPPAPPLPLILAAAAGLK